MCLCTRGEAALEGCPGQPQAGRAWENREVVVEEWTQDLAGPLQRQEGEATLVEASRGLLSISSI